MAHCDYATGKMYVCHLNHSMIQSNTAFFPGVKSLLSIVAVYFLSCVWTARMDVGMLTSTNNVKHKKHLFCHGIQKVKARQKFNVK